MEYSEDLDRKFKKIGFDNFKTFYQSDSPIQDYPNKHNPLSEVYLMDDLHSDPDNIGYIFLVAKDSHTEQWNILSIDASIQMDTKGNVQKMKVINSNYLSSEKPLPHKNDIRKELLERLSVEKAKELSYAIHKYAGQMNGAKIRR